MSDAAAMEETDRAVVQALRRLPGIAVLLVFGSRARAGGRSDSDLDVAVLPAASDPTARRHLQSDIATALAHLAPGGRVDVVLVDEAPELLRQRIMETGRVLRCDAPALWKQWRVRTMREHGDREPVRAMLREAQHRRLTGAGARD